MVCVCSAALHRFESSRHNRSRPVRVAAVKGNRIWQSGHKQRLLRRPRTTTNSQEVAGRSGSQNGRARINNQAEEEGGRERERERGGSVVYRCWNRCRDGYVYPNGTTGSGEKGSVEQWIKGLVDDE
jgi:hypothetical protein